MAEGPSIGKVTLELLKYTDSCLRWSSFIKVILNRGEILGHIHITEVLERGATQTKVNAFKKKDCMARSHIVLHLRKRATTNLKSIFIEDSSAQMVWSRLLETYQKDNLQDVLNFEGKVF